MAVRPIDGNKLIEWFSPYLHTGEPIPADVVIEDIRSMPTLTQPNEPLTLEQLRKMDGQPVWVKMKTIHELTGWAIVHIDYQMGAIRLWGKGGNWLRFNTGEMDVYAYPPAHIDREAWEPCGAYVPKIVTNADRIRAMSDEELATFIVDKSPGMFSCNGRCLYWLRQPAEED